MLSVVAKAGSTTMPTMNSSTIAGTSAKSRSRATCNRGRTRAAVTGPVSAT